MSSCVLAAVALLSVSGPAASAADIVPYRAFYRLSLASTQSSSGVVGANGMLLDEWNATCDGRTEQEHFYLHLDYGDDQSAGDTYDTYTNMVSWEARDGSRFRFDLRRASDDKPYEEIAGQAAMKRRGGGSISFTHPASTTVDLAPGTLFPAAHTLFLITHAEAGDRLVSRPVFDGSDIDSTGLVTAVIGRKLQPDAESSQGPKASSLLARPSWRIRLAFFPADRAAETPDYEESERLLDNGIVEDMLFDYGDYSIQATLEQIEALPRPRC